MGVTSANIHDLATFVNGSSRRVGRLSTTLSAVSNKANVIMPACAGSQYPSTPSIAALNELLTAWAENGEFVRVVHDELIEADQYDADGNATVSNTAIDASLKKSGLDDAPDLVDVDAIELYGQPPYSGFVDDPISLANGNFLLREGDLALFGAAAPLSVVRAYNSRDPRTGAFGPGWTSLVDVALAIEGRRATFRGPDGGGSVRIPAALTGLVGFKATFGRVPVHPVSATPTLAHGGVLARNVRALNAGDAELGGRAGAQRARAQCR